MIFSDFQDDLKKNELCQLHVDEHLYSGPLFFALVHDHPQLVKEPIRNHYKYNSTPFRVFHLDERSEKCTKYLKCHIQFIGAVHGAVIQLTNDKMVNFTFPLLSSDSKSKTFLILVGLLSFTPNTYLTLLKTC